MLVLLQLLTFIPAQTINISVINVRNIPHEMIILANNLNAPSQLAMDHERNTLFFSTDTEVDFGSESGCINLDTSDAVTIRNLPGGFANAVDSDNHTVYLGARNGVYKYNYETESAEIYSARGINVWQLFYNDYLYFTDHVFERAFVFTQKNGTFKEVPQLKGIKVKVLGVDNNNNIYFSNSSGLFKVKNGRTYISKVGDWNADAFTTDVDGNLFFCTNRGLFVISNDKIVLLASVHPVYGMALYKNGEIIYSNSRQIIKLRPNVNYSSKSDYYRLLNINFPSSTRNNWRKLFID